MTPARRKPRMQSDRHPHASMLLTYVRMTRSDCPVTHAMEG